MTNFGIRVSKQGKQANTEELKDLVFDSDADIVKTIKSGVVNLTISGGTGTVDVYHGLNRYPTFTAYYGDGNYYLIETANSFSDNHGRQSSSVHIGVNTDKNNLTIKGRGTDGTYAVYYEIFEQGGYK